jgi:hypothetical protein
MAALSFVEPCLNMECGCICLLDGGVSGLRNGMIGWGFCIDGTMDCIVGFCRTSFSFQTIVTSDENNAMAQQLFIAFFSIYPLGH